MNTLVPWLISLIWLLPQAQLPPPQTHSTSRAQVTSPHGNLNMPCENCHTNSSWRPLRAMPQFDHNKTKYPLRGMHVDVTCMKCHTSLVFSNVSMTCAACHADLHRGQFGSSCERCHTVKGWKVGLSKIQQHDNRFPLLGAHATVECDACHKSAAVGQFAGLSVNCVSCHQTQYQTAVPDHVALGFGPICQNCHTSFDTWLGAKFDHAKLTGFALTGMHATLACVDCHVGDKFAGTPVTCFGCHAADFNGTTNPPHAAAGFSHDCATCHSTASWSGATFDHSKFTKFPLTGAHMTTPCASCHVNGQFAGTPTACASCHIKDYNGTTNPNHQQAGIPTDCSQCHTTTNWTGATFDHSKFTKFPLTGVHASTPCVSCHVNGQFAGTPTACASCHIAAYNTATNPNHKQLGFPTDCSTCHTTSGWTPASFDHSKTGFTLTGAHNSLPCSSCHVNGNFNLTQTTCVSCHLNDYNGTTNPNHKQLGFATNCTTCHNTTNWTTVTFDHSTTGFPLNGAHTSLPCASCHVNNNYNLTQTTCVSCHLNDYNNTTNPNHKQAGFPTDCTTCHNTTNWTNATFDHAKTGFPLTGSHTSLPCASCHVNGNFNLTQTSCVSCHLNDYNGTTNPNHKAAGFPTDCTTCHNTTSWTAATFDHSKTGFPLTGAHTSLPCASCHVNNNYNLTQTTCVSCHLTDYNNATNPNHKQLGFPTDCTTCHNTTNWTNATFDHSKTGFPLTGAHTSLPCASCHVNNNYNLTQTTCVSCHLNDYNNTTNPNHKQLGFTTNCTTCHNTTNWTNATFNHNTTGFPLTGAHTSLPCASCHVNNNYNLTQTTCVSCHLNDYNNTTNPNHKQLGFPTDCATCHNTTNWTNATFNHNTTGFPLTGAHTSLPCASCHVNNNYNLTQTACIACHQNDYNGTTNPPHKSAGFPTDCTICHSTVNWTSATFNHSTTGFPLTGAHVSLQCAQCHVNNNYNLTQTACIACHQADYNGTNNPPHAAAGFSTDCTGCHSTTNWTSATFNHTTTGFALTGAHTSLACASCHVNNNYHLTSTACISCHQTDYNNTNNPPHKSAGFPTDCTICHSTTNWTSATFNHNTTGFALTGAHVSLQCAQCHVNNNYNITVTTCISCHQADYNGTNNPPHAAAGFPTDCTICHSTTNWTSATFNHTTTGFALTGAHTSLQCSACHVNNNYSLKSPLCSTCHMADYNGTTNPSHVSAGFPTTCDTCHTTTSWAGATFNHPTTPFALTGAHVTLACSACHLNNNYTTPPPTDCYSCHKADYTGTTNPNHAAAGFPTTCATCHTTTTWTGATFNHTWFPMKHGNANGVCATCHTNPNDYSVFTCTVCHGGNVAANFHHPNVSGYVYNSVNCYQCHKNGNGG